MLKKQELGNLLFVLIYKFLPGQFGVVLPLDQNNVYRSLHCQVIHSSFVG